ncbi:MAG: Fur family transcriptional regulator [Candidatus Polarisedimenticolia bacterium]
MPPTAHAEKIAQFGQYLAGLGLKTTPERRAIVSEVLQIEEHFDPEVLESRLRRKGRRVSRATIYRTLEHLINSGLVRKTSLDLEHKITFYENTLVREHHEHMICLGCGGVTEFTSEAIERLQDDVCLKHRFKPVRHTHQIVGFCRKCH